jgi:alcohol dehydrogenase, propanol-preferring
VDAWVVARPGPVTSGALERTEVPEPAPGRGEVLVRVRTCGVCRTDLHVVEGDLPSRRERVVPGHEIVGVVERCGEGARRFAPGQRVGIPWLRWTCGVCRACRRGAENLCPRSRFTGWSDDGGYAELAVVDEAYAYELPDALDDAEAAPLLCAGIIGYRALLRSGFRPGDRLGIWGFGGSAHLTAQVARSLGGELYVATRGHAARALARELGAVWVGGALEPAPVPLDAAISFAPAGELVPVALRSLAPGGVLALAGIHVTDLPPLVYERDLFHERELRSVTANTRADGERFLAIAARIGVRVTTVPYPFADAAAALVDLAEGRVVGAAVLDLAS